MVIPSVAKISPHVNSVHWNETVRDDSSKWNA